MPAHARRTNPAPALLLPRAHQPMRPLPPDATLWRLSAGPAAAAELLATIRDHALPVWVAGTREADGRWALYLWAPGTAAPLAALLARASAAPLGAGQLPDGRWWACGRALTRLLAGAGRAP